MARINNLTNFLNDVSSAIKEKTGDSTPIPASQFDTKIASITTGGTYQEKNLNITTNGNYNLLPDTGYDAMSKVGITVNVSDAPMDPTTATEDDVINPKTFYSNGQKLTGAIIPTYKSLSHTVHYDDIVANNQVCAITEDGACIVAWRGTTLYTYLRRNEDDYTLANTYPESELSIIYNDYNTYTKQLDIGIYIENKICYVVAHQYQNNIAVICLNAETGVLGYNENGYFGSFSYRNNYVEPCRSITFSNKRADVYTCNCNDGFNQNVTYLCKINSEGSRTNIQTISSQNVTYQQFTGDDTYVLCDNILYKNNSYTSLTQATTFADKTYINKSKTLCVSGGKLYELNDTGTTLTLGTELAQDFQYDQGGWIGDTLYLGLTGSDLVVYNCEDTTNIITTTIQGVTRFIAKHYNYALLNLANTSIKLISLVNTGAKILMSITTRNNETLYNPSGANATSAHVLSGKKFINESGLITGMMPNNGQLTFTPTDNQQTIPAGYTSGGTISAVDITALAEYQTCLSITEDILGPTYLWYEHVKYLRWSIAGIKSGESILQLSEFGLCKSSSDTTDRFDFSNNTIITSNQTGSVSTGEEVDKIIDNNINTKYCVSEFREPCIIDIDLNDDTIDLTEYKYYYYYTANDSPNRRDPITWSLCASDDGITYYTIDTQRDLSITGNRKALAGIWSINL